MKLNSSFSKLTLAVTLAAAALAGPSASAAENPFHGGRIAVQSGKTYEAVAGAIKTVVAQNGMMVMAEVDQGKMLSMAGLQLKGKLFLVGNPNVGKQIFEQNHAVGLYVPVRIFVFADASGKTFVEYDKPSSVLSQFSNDKINMIAKMLDEKIAGLAQMAAK